MQPSSYMFRQLTTQEHYNLYGTDIFRSSLMWLRYTKMLAKAKVFWASYAEDGVEALD